MSCPAKFNLKKINSNKGLLCLSWNSLEDRNRFNLEWLKMRSRHYCSGLNINSLNISDFNINGLNINGLNINEFDINALNINGSNIDDFNILRY